MSLLLQSLFLADFKNYENVHLEFSEKVNCWTGENGAGKTNVLDAIYYLCMCKSYFNPLDTQNIRHGKNVFKIEGTFDLNGAKEVISCKMEEGSKKEFLRNKKKYQKLSEHIGVLPIVMIAPDDILLLNGGSEERRKFMDSMLAQLDREYLENLMSYNKILFQRNATLRQFIERNFFDAQLLAGWDNQLVEFGIKIFEKRKEIMNEFFPLFQKYYAIVSGEKEKASGEYSTDLSESIFADLLKKNIAKDKILMRTSAGIHKDDILFTIDDYAVKRFGSQGQMKAFLIALKLAQFELLKVKKRITPILLLDDIFDKLDNHRVSFLIDLIVQKYFGQIFITDTDETRMENILKQKKADYKMFRVANGKIE